MNNRLRTKRHGGKVNNAPRSTNRPNYLFLLVAGLILLATFGVYWQVGDHEFISYDDQKYVTENSHVQSGLTLAGLKWAFTKGHAANWHPLTWLSHMVDCELFGLDAGAHHMVNVLFHLANTALLFWVLFRMTGGLWRSAFVAALFALHPLHVESVAWVAERKDVLSTFFWILTMWAYLRYTERKCAGRYLLVVLVFALGLMAKPMLVTLPFVLLLLDYWPLARLEFSPPISKVKSNIFALILEKLPLFVLAGCASVVTFFVQKSGDAVVAAKHLPTYLRIGNAIVSYVEYLGKMVWPGKLAVLYPLPWDSLAVWHIAGAMGLLVCITGLVIGLRNRKWLTMGWLWYLGTLVPVIGLVQVGSQAMADRYTYVPLIGIFIMIAWGANEFVPKWRRRNLLFGVLAIVILCSLSVRTWFQLGYWRDSVTLYKRSISVTKNNYQILYNLAGVFSKLGETQESVKTYNKYMQIKPSDPDGHFYLAIQLGKLDQADKAIVHLQEAIRIIEFNKDVRSWSFHPDAYYNLGFLLGRQGQEDEAIRYYKKAIQLDGDYAHAHNNLGAILLTQGKLSEAIEHFREVVRLMPNNPKARSNLAKANKLLIEKQKGMGVDNKNDFK